MSVRYVSVDNVTVLPSSAAKRAANLLVLQSYPKNQGPARSVRNIQVETQARIHAQKGSLLVLAQTAQLSADILIGNDTTGWGSWDQEFYVQPWKFNNVIRDSFTPYIPGHDVQRWPQAKQVFEPEVYIKPWTYNNVVLAGFMPYVPGQDVRRSPQALYYEDYAFYLKPWTNNRLITEGSSPAPAPVPYVLGIEYQQAEQVLGEYDFGNIQVDFAYDVVNPPGIVFAQSPVAGTLWPYSSVVTIVVSQGPYVPPTKQSISGYKVTTRAFSLEEMVSREWGSSFRAPDHRIYNFTGRSFDSTDIGTTGIYSRGIENPAVPGPPFPPVEPDTESTWTADSDVPTADSTTPTVDGG